MKGTKGYARIPACHQQEFAMPDTLSIAIVALNEEANLGRVLESVRWADEIVVVDSGSTDRTCDIAREYGARVIHEPWLAGRTRAKLPSASTWTIR